MKAKALIGQFKEICSNCYYRKPISKIVPFTEVLQYQLEFKNQLHRGVLIEKLIIDKVLLMNEMKSIHCLEGIIIKGKYKIRDAYTNSELGYSLWPLRSSYTSHKRFKSDDVTIESPEIFIAKYRCLTQPRIETCCIDLIIDDTIIDIKTDINTKHLNKYVRQVFIQTIQYASFLDSIKEYNSKFHDLHIEMIEKPINNIAVFFWRSNEFYKYSIREMLENEDDFDKMVNIYTTLRALYGVDLRILAKKHLFSNF